MLACCLVNSDSDFLFHAGVFVRAYDLELTYNALSRMSVWCPVRDKSLTLFLAAASSVSFNFHLCLILCLIFAIAAEIILSHVQLNIKHLLFFPTFHSQPSDSPSAEIHLTINMYNISGNNICMPVSRACDWQKLHSWRCEKSFAWSLKSSLGQTYFCSQTVYCSL